MKVLCYGADHVEPAWIDILVGVSSGRFLLRAKKCIKQADGQENDARGVVSGFGVIRVSGFAGCHPNSRRLSNFILRARNKMKASRAERDMVASEESEPRNRRRSTATSRIPGRWSTTEEAVYRSA
jgi:hypothetical protein